MGFQLVIAEGKEAGREFEFDQASVVIGRTAECDVILYEAGVSRRHARIFLDGPAYCLEDLGSSNGTLVNGDRVEGVVELREGDSIGLGPVLFNFKPLELAPEAPTDETPQGGAHTRIVSVAELKRSRNRGVVGLEKGATREQVAEMGRRSTTVMPAYRPGSAALAAKASVRPVRRGPPPRLAKAEADLPEGVEVAGGGRPRLVRMTGEHPALSAADRARLKRGGATGTLRLWWAQASTAKRAAAVAGLVVAGLGVVGALVFAALPEEAKPRGPEPKSLSSAPVEASFGLGPRVSWERADQKTFDFEVTSPVQVMVVLHYQAQDIGAKDEVSITVNGHELGWVPPDTLDAAEQTHELIVPAAVVKRNAMNAVTFDHARNPPEQDPWRIWNLWVEVAVLPEKDQAGLIAEAESRYKKGTQEWEQRDIGASNRWDAYKAFREAWLTLEAIPAASRPYTYQLARDRMSEARRALDEQCRSLLLKARSAFNLKQYDAARLELDHVADFFPSRSHPCQFRAEQARYEMEL